MGWASRTEGEKGGEGGRHVREVGREDGGRESGCAIYRIFIVISDF
jgi:hypothetical protein